MANHSSLVEIKVHICHAKNGKMRAKRAIVFISKVTFRYVQVFGCNQESEIDIKKPTKQGLQQNDR